MKILKWEKHEEITCDICKRGADLVCVVCLKDICSRCYILLNRGDFSKKYEPYDARLRGYAICKSHIEEILDAK